MKDLSVLSSPDNYNELVLYVKNDTIPHSCFRNGPAPAVGLKYDLDAIDIPATHSQVSRSEFDLVLRATNAIDLLLINPGPKCKRPNTNLWSNARIRYLPPTPKSKSCPRFVCQSLSVCNFNAQKIGDHCRTSEFLNYVSRALLGKYLPPLQPVGNWHDCPLTSQLGYEGKKNRKENPNWCFFLHSS